MNQAVVCIVLLSSFHLIATDQEAVKFLKSLENYLFIKKDYSIVNNDFKLIIENKKADGSQESNTYERDYFIKLTKSSSVVKNLFNSQNDFAVGRISSTTNSIKQILLHSEHISILGIEDKTLVGGYSLRRVMLHNFVG